MHSRNEELAKIQQDNEAMQHAACMVASLQTAA